jgi:nucleotide-binding universal stress UspA family protein|uniref:Universal stress protein n=1 Tax=Desulfobacca acetoxidans TaxID=60893 RepID=A0A7C3SJZ6_9BACT
MIFPACPLALEKLLVCTDSSPASHGAVIAGLDLARSCRSQVFLLEVLEYPPGYAGLAPEAVIQWEKEVAADLAGIKAEAQDLGVPAEIVIRHADRAFAAIVEEAEKLKADLIVMGRHGKHGLTKLLMGSVTERVIGLSPVNVLVVPPDWPLAWEKVLIAHDGSPYSEAAWEAALEMVRRLNARLIGVSAAREERELPEADAVVQKMLAQASRQGISLEVRVSVGAPDEVIIEAARSAKANLIVMGSLGRTGLKRLLMGSTTARVIGQAFCPVLVVKRRE